MAASWGTDMEMFALHEVEMSVAPGEALVAIAEAGSRMTAQSQGLATIAVGLGRLTAEGKEVRPLASLTVAG